MRKTMTAMWAGAVLLAAGCATEMAMLRPGQIQVVQVQADYDQAFAEAVAAAKESGYGTVSEKKEKNFIYLQKGMGYGEFSSMTVKFTPGSPTTSVQIEAKSSKGAQALIDEFLAAYRKRVKTS